MAIYIIMKTHSRNFKIFAKRQLTYIDYTKHKTSTSNNVFSMVGKVIPRLRFIRQSEYCQFQECLDDFSFFSIFMAGLVTMKQ